VVSQHIGDLENHETLEFFREALANLKSVYRAEPVAIAHDLHPGYFSTRWALEQEGLERWASSITGRTSHPCSRRRVSRGRSSASRSTAQATARTGRCGAGSS